MKQRRPPHLYRDNTWYMITASTYRHQAYLSTPQQRLLLQDALHQLIRMYQMRLTAWVILDNHYHLLIKTSSGNRLPDLMKRLHGTTSRTFNHWDSAPGRTVWYSYWDTCIRDEAGYWTRFNYIHLNPVRHRYVSHPADWTHSSYSQYVTTHGQPWLNEILSRYPVRSADLMGDEPEGHNSGD